MKEELPSELAKHIRTLLRAFTISELNPPRASGGFRHNAPDRQALHYIGENPKCQGNAVAAFLCVAPTTAQSILDRLLKRGLIERQASQTNKRVVALSITSAGAAFRTDVLRQDELNCAHMLAALTGPEQRSFVMQIGRIAEAIDGKSAS
jgi:DNA-binding MarR family transcriptional regulator